MLMEVVLDLIKNRVSDVPINIYTFTFIFSMNVGRINLVELSKTLNVDLNHITARIPEIEKSSGCSIIMGQLINKTYQRTIAEEINERLQRDGQITTADLTKLYDLPGDFLQSVSSNYFYLESNTLCLFNYSTIFIIFTYFLTMIQLRINN